MMKILFLVVMFLAVPTKAHIGPSSEDALTKMGYAGCFGWTRAEALEWYCSETPIPTDTEVHAQHISAAKMARKQKVKTELREKVLALYTIEDLLFAALGLMTDQEKTDMKAAIQPILQAAKQAAIAINALTTVSQIEVFTW